MGSSGYARTESSECGGDPAQAEDLTFFPTNLVPKVPQLPKNVAGDREQTGETKTDQVLHFPNGKVVDERTDLKPWPSITGFRTWKLAFKKQVAAASTYMEQALACITEVAVPSHSWMPSYQQRWTNKNVWRVPQTSSS